MRSRIVTMPVWAHLGASGLAIAGFMGAKARLDASYAASGHPVDYATGQLAFDADVIAGYYRVMQDAGTLGVYVRTQVIDFGFIAMMAAVALLLAALVARIGRPGSAARRVGRWTALAGVTGAGCDVVENLISFAMLARPDAIPQALALAYSSAAAAKFGLLTLAMVGLAVTLVLAIISRLRG